MQKFKLNVKCLANEIIWCFRQFLLIKLYLFWFDLKDGATFSDVISLLFSLATGNFKTSIYVYLCSWGYSIPSMIVNFMLSLNLTLPSFYENISSRYPRYENLLRIQSGFCRNAEKLSSISRRRERRRRNHIPSSSCSSVWLPFS